MPKSAFEISHFNFRLKAKAFFCMFLEISSCNALEVFEISSEFDFSCMT